MRISPFLILENVTIRSFEEVLFQNLNLTIKKGEHWAVTGNNDVVASQFLKIFNKNYKLQGKIDLCFYDDYKRLNQPIDDPLFYPEKLIALVSQKHNFKNLSNRNEFYYQQRYNAHDAENAPTVEIYLSQISSFSKNPYWNVDNTVETLQLIHLKNKSLIKLSNGETKRLLIAAALLKNPCLLLLDHPYTGLDVNMRSILNEIIKEIIHSGITIILAAAPNEIPESITHVAVLEDKKIADTYLRDDFKADIIYEDNKKIIIQENLFPLNELQPFQEFESIVTMNNVTIRYDKKIILNNINWHVKQGERWALLGPNGAGKTTLLSLINGDNPQAYANDIVIFDKKRGSGESIWDIKEKIGFISPELFQFFPTDFTCLQVVESGFYDSIGLYRKSNPKNATLSERWMQKLQIQKYAAQNFNRTPANIQRFCLLARALVKNPPLLLLDEPCQGLERQQKLALKKLIDEICIRSKITLIYVTHYQEEIPSQVNKLANLENGKIIYKGEFDVQKVFK